MNSLTMTGQDPWKIRRALPVLCLLGSNIISWSSRKQQTIALSSVEAEYTVAIEAAYEAVWLRKLLADLGQKQEVPTVIC